MLGELAEVVRLQGDAMDAGECGRDGPILAETVQRKEMRARLND